MVPHLHVHEHSHLRLVLPEKTARQPEHNKMQDFARAYLYYKMVFLAVSLVIVILLLIVGIIGINKLFAYMELL